MPTDPGALYRLLSWFSPAFPVGSFAYSHGLEQAAADGIVRDAETLLAWLRDLLHCGSFWNDAVLLAAAHRGDDVAQLPIALCSCAERLRETCDQGRAFLLANGQAGDAQAYPVAVGRIAAAQGIALHDVLPAYLHALCSNQIAAALRAIALGQRAGVAVLAQLEPDVLDAAARAARSCLNDLGSACVMAEIAAMRHETLQPRIFIS